MVTPSSRFRAMHRLVEIHVWSQKDLSSLGVPLSSMRPCLRSDGNLDMFGTFVSRKVPLCIAAQLRREALAGRIG